MRRPDSQQKNLTGEYYVASGLARLGYDINITVDRAKVFDMTALGAAGKTVSIQVKSTYNYNDWLVPHELDSSQESVIALVRLRHDAGQKPELYFLPAARANNLITRKYQTHSPRICRKDVCRDFQDHNFALLERVS